MIATVLDFEEGARMETRPVKRQRVPDVFPFDALVHLYERRGAVEPLFDELRQPVFETVPEHDVYIEQFPFRLAHPLRVAAAGGDDGARVFPARASDQLAAFAVGDGRYRTGDDDDDIRRSFAANRPFGLERRGDRLALILIGAAALYVYREFFP